MNDKNPSRPYDMQDDEELYNEMMEVASATECTGLMPTPPITRSETKSYDKIYDIPLAEDEAVNEMKKRAETKKQ